MMKKIYNYHFTNKKSLYGCYFSCIFEICEILNCGHLIKPFMNYLIENYLFTYDTLLLPKMNMSTLNDIIISFFGKHGIVVSHIKDENSIDVIRNNMGEGCVPMVVYDQYYDPSCVFYQKEAGWYHYCIVYGYDDEECTLNYKDYKIDGQFDYKQIGYENFILGNQAYVNERNKPGIVLFKKTSDMSQRIEDREVVLDNIIKNNDILDRFCIELSKAIDNPRLLTEDYIIQLFDFFYFDYKSLKAVEYNALKLEGNQYLKNLCNTCHKLRYSRRHRDLVKFQELLKIYLDNERELLQVNIML